ncbi:Probable CCR4-associated factor 1 homolog 1 [Linum grandiflorum]
MAAHHVRDVWNHNFHQEFYAMQASLRYYPIVSLDSEFPGFLHDTPRYDSEEARFHKLKLNVDATSLIQLGFTLCNSHGTVGGVWQFNFQFDLDRDLYCQKSIDFLTTHGIDFQKLKTHGVDRVKFASMFAALIGRRQTPITWVTFHGVYDYTHIVKAVTFRPVAESSQVFLDVLGRVFDSVVDVKFMANFFKETGSEIGLQKLADALGVKRSGEAHTAASDSLLTALVYFELKSKLVLLGVDEEVYGDFIYGITTRISRKHKQPPRLVPIVPMAGPCLVYYHPHQHLYQQNMMGYPVPHQHLYQQQNMMMGRWIDCSSAPRW